MRSRVIYELERPQIRLVALVMFVAFAVSAYQTIDLNFINYDNDDQYYVYVYAHTRRGTLDLVKNIEQIAADHEGTSTGITIVSPDYWPLPWYLRNYDRVGYFGRMAPSAEPLIIANEQQKAEVEANFGGLSPGGVERWQRQKLRIASRRPAAPLRPAQSFVTTDLRISENLGRRPGFCLSTHN